MFVAALGLFHEMEYVQTSIWNPQHLSLDCMLATAEAPARRSPGLTVHDVG